jgi:formylglycine-generating enzyme required for sulfatase activity
MLDRSSKHMYFRPVRSLRPAFFLLFFLAACDTELPIEPEESRFSEAGLSLSVDAINFDPTFMGRTSTSTVEVEYGDTLEMVLILFTSDTAFFKVNPDSVTFSKQKRNVTLALSYTPGAPDKVDTGYLFLVALSCLDTLKTEPDTTGVDSLRLAGVGQGYFLDMEMIFIPGGTFTMGIDSASAAGDIRLQDEWPAHEVTLSDFFVGRYEVTNIQYYEFWKEVSPDHTPRDTSAMGSWPDVALNRPNFPVIGASWADATAFCRWLSLRTGERYTLPTEAQWEYVATGGQRREFPWSLLEGETDTTSTENGSTVYANVRRGGDGYTFTAPVDAFQAGASAFGPLNMAGNVWEWCLDWYDSNYYRSEEIFVDPQGSTNPEHQTFKVIRGGSWLDDLHEASCTNRAALAPENQEINTGFRVVRLP